MKEKSKIIKLKNKQNRLKFWHKWGGWILCVNSLISIILLMPYVMANVAPTLALIESLYLGFSVLSSFEHELFGEKKTKQKIQDLDQQILNLIKADEEEVKILSEFNKIDEIQKDVCQMKQQLKEQKQLVKEMIKTKNEEAKKQKNYIKELTIKYKKQAKENAEKDVEEMLKHEDILSNIEFD